MLAQTHAALFTVVYGLWLVGSGVYRHLESDGGNANALGFGIVTGAMVLVGAALLARGKRRTARILVGIAVVFVLGFFVSATVRWICGSAAPLRSACCRS